MKKPNKTINEIPESSTKGILGEILKKKSEETPYNIPENILIKFRE